MNYFKKEYYLDTLLKIHTVIPAGSPKSFFFSRGQPVLMLSTGWLLCHALLTSQKANMFSFAIPNLVTSACGHEEEEEEGGEDC